MDPFPLAEARDDVQGDRHELEGDDNKIAHARRRAPASRAARRAWRRSTRSPAAESGARSDSEASTPRMVARERAASRDRQLVLDEGDPRTGRRPARRGTPSRGGRRADGHDDAELPLVLAAPGEATTKTSRIRTEDRPRASCRRSRQDSEPEEQRHGRRVHGPDADARRHAEGRVCHQDDGKATHSGPWRRTGVWKCGSAALDPRDLLGDAEYVDGGQEAPSTPGKSHQE